MAKPKRPTKLTMEMQDKACTLAMAMPSDAALCRALRIDPTTWVAWKHKAKEGKQPYADFMERFDEAAAFQEIDMLSKIGGDPDWRAKAWLLERRKPADYSPKHLLEHTGKGGKELKLGAPAVNVILQVPEGTVNPYAPPPGKQG